MEMINFTDLENILVDVQKRSLNTELGSCFFKSFIPEIFEEIEELSILAVQNVNSTN